MDAIERHQVTRAELSARTRQIISAVATLCTAAGVFVSIIVAIVK